MEEFNKLWRESKYSYVIFTLTDDLKEVVVEKTSDEGNYEAFSRTSPRVSADMRSTASRARTG
ncbi:hypothetical protein ACF06X_32925 [Streptomyces sp. NPDC015346]|uniref:hypothetical protein n=1 Tax=Streptomyces sp. NPDC015346 TaxID=3364954 RepID=UPI0036F70E78